ncbi:MAG: transferrin-binding protein-like solute binding protein [Aestuariivirga sp.]|nr:transferrin-binding protein-like solute binding protein [Aestuariivirga sp.]
MRIGSVSALALAAFVLAACEGTPTTGSSASVATLDLCGLSCPDPTGGGGINDADGDGVDDGADGDDSSTDGGNTTNLNPTTADVTIAVESSRLVKPTGNTTSLSLLTAGTSPTTTTAQILSGAKPTKLTIQIDTNSTSNGNWPTPVQMTEYVEGTNAPDLTGGNKGGTNCLPNCGYREYRIYSNSVGQERDESLQVWAWNESYAAHYTNESSAGDPAQQAWSFGGNKTPLTDMPLGGSATYNGRFVATALTENYRQPNGADINPNALWRVQGASSVTANFNTVSVAGTLTPETWESDQEGVGGWYIKSTTDGINTAAMPHYAFYDTTVTLNGTITGNTYAGTTAGSATLSGPFISGDETMYGGFFGAGASETTGVFHVTGMDPDPIGGSAGITDPKRGFLTIQGAFNGTTP